MPGSHLGIVRAGVTIIFLVAAVSGADEVDRDGALTVGGITCKFSVDICSFIDHVGIQMPMQSLGGTGTTADGQMCLVMVTDASQSERPQQAISLHAQSVGPAPFVAEYEKAETGWSSRIGSDAKQLIRMEGDRVKARGIFAREGEDVGEGVLDAPCPPPM